jgi:hypothetical protein
MTIQNKKPAYAVKSDDSKFKFQYPAYAVKGDDSNKTKTNILPML